MEIETCKVHSLPLRKLDWASLIPLIGDAREALARYDEVVKRAPLSKLNALIREEASASMRGQDAEKIQYVKEGLEFAMRWKGSLNLSFFSKVHGLVKRDAADPKEIGHLRERQNWIGPQGCSIEKAYFYPPAPQKVKLSLQNLMLYAKGKEKDPLVQLAIFFAQFLIIHPFMDGNGRVARIHIPIYLHRKKLLSKPYFFLSRYFETHRTAYFQKLFNISEKGAWENWIAYFLRGVIEESYWH